MSIPIWLSVDYDYFVRYLPDFDWAHQESPFFQGGAMWMVRVASHHSVGGDLREDMDPQKYATPKPQSFFSVLKQLGYDFSETEYVLLADSHAMAGPVFNQLGREEGVPELLISFDAHHDLGYHGWSRTKEFVDQDQCSCDMWLCAVLCWYEQLRTRIIYPPWQSDRDLAVQREHIRDNIPASMLKRVKADLFSHGGAVSDLVKPPRGQTFDVQAIFICRSSAWVPPWLDESFNEFVETVDDELGLDYWAPGVFEGVAESPMEPRTDFDYDAAVQQGEQMRMMMELGPDGFREMVEDLKDEKPEPEENPGYETEDGFIDWRDEPDGEHGPGIWVTEMAVDDEKQGQGIGRHLYQQVEAQWPEGTLVYVYALAKDFWEKMGFEPLYRQPDGVEWFDESYGSVDYWNQLDMELVKRIGGNTPPPIVVTPEDLPS